MYHRLPSERHAQFRGLEASGEVRFTTPQSEMQPSELLSAIGGPVAGLDEPMRWRLPDRAFNLETTDGQAARALRQTDKVEATPGE